MGRPKSVVRDDQSTPFGETSRARELRRVPGRCRWLELSGAVEEPPRFVRPELINRYAKRRTGHIRRIYRLFGRERAGRRVGEPRRADRVQVSLGRLEVGVTEDVANRDRVEHPREQRAGGVAEVVEAQRRKAGGVARDDVSAADG